MVSSDISATKEGRKLCPKQSKGKSKLHCKEFGDGSEAADSSSLFVQPSAKTEKTDDALVMQAAARTKKFRTCGDCNVIKKALKVMRRRTICLQARSSKWPHGSSEASPLVEYDHTMPLEAPTAHFAAPTLPENMDKAWLAAV